MRLLLIGYGKMGKVIEAVATKREHTIAGKIDPGAGLNFDFREKVDAAIEFTSPDAAPANIRLCLDRDIPVLSGTTGWLSQKDEIDNYCRLKNGTFFYSSNFSIGVNIFFRLNEKLAQMMARQTDYEIIIDETHHAQKKDAPSGTAITLAEGVLRHISRKKQWVKNETTQPGDLVIRSFRQDPIPGTHVVQYHSLLDDIEIKHTAHSREGFARGAVAVAEWLADKKGLLGMDDFLKSE